MTFAIPKEPSLQTSYLTLSAHPEAPGAVGYFWGRGALFCGLEALGLKPGDEVLVPSFICNVATQAMVGFGVIPVFYPVDKSCRADFAALDQLVTRRTRMLFAVHYFGFPCDVDAALAFCRKHNLQFFEDGAHVLSSQWAGAELGTFGDAAILSWRKFLPIYDGAFLVLKDPRVAPRQRKFGSTKRNLKIIKTLLTGALMRIRPPKTNIGTKPQITCQSPANGPVRSDDPTLWLTPNHGEFWMPAADWAMTGISNWIVRHSDLRAVSEARRKNYRFLASALLGVDGLSLLLPNVPDTVCPWVLPALFLQKKACARLRAEGVPAGAWDGVIPAEVKLDSFPDAQFLYDHLVFLPVHQSLKEEHLQQIAITVRSII